MNTMNCPNDTTQHSAAISKPSVADWAWLDTLAAKPVDPDFAAASLEQSEMPTRQEVDAYFSQTERTGVIT